jgi:hypothetical protein
MRKLLVSSLLLPFLFVSPSQAQQVNVYSENYCYMNVEQYVPGYYDFYGRYIPGYVNRTRNRVSCNNVSVNQQPYYRPRVCNPAAGAAMGAGLAEALSGGNGWRSSSSWNRNYNRRSASGSYNYSNRNYASNGWTLFGAGLGALMYSC